MPKLEIYKLTEKEILSMVIPYGNNRVLLKTVEKNTESTTPSGILKISPTETDWNEANHASRWGEVVKMPRKLKYDPEDGSSLSWNPTVEIYEGMIVWYDYLDSLNCVTYFDEYNSEYKLIEYANLYVGIIPVGIKNSIVDESIHSKTKDGKHWVVPLNGYILFDKVNEKPLTLMDIYIPKKNDPSIGKAVYLSRPNKEYSGGYNDDINVQRGDICSFTFAFEVMLEHESYAVFDGGTPYKRMQRKTIEFLWRGDKLIIAKDRVLVRPHADVLVTEYGLKLFKDHKTHSHGTVIQSTYDELKEGDEIIFQKGAGRLLDVKNETHRLINIKNVLGIVIKTNKKEDYENKI